MEWGEVIEERFRRFLEQLRQILSENPASMDPDLAQSILVVWEAIIGQNFIPWLLQAWMGCRSHQAREACRQNLLEEIGEDHRAMLERFVESGASSRWMMHGEPEISPQLTATVKNITQAIAASGYNAIWIMAFLEYGPAVWMPFLAVCGRRAGATDFTYTDVHIAGDPEHARLFTDAIDWEGHAQSISSQAESWETLSELILQLVRGILADARTYDRFIRLIT